MGSLGVYVCDTFLYLLISFHNLFFLTFCIILDIIMIS